jgi:hypothetical protein
VKFRQVELATLPSSPWRQHGPWKWNWNGSPIRFDVEIDVIPLIVVSSDIGLDRLVTARFKPKPIGTGPQVYNDVC